MSIENSMIKPFCISAYVIRINENMSEYLLLHRCSKHLNGNWQMISGGIHESEKAWQAALREIKEETGLIPDRFYSADTIETFYEAMRNAIVFVPVFVAFIERHQRVVLSPKEHDNYEWLSFEKTLDRLEFPNQRRIITHVETEFVKRNPSSRLSIALPIKSP